MTAKKHRLVIEVTTSAPVTERDIVRGLQQVLDERLDLDAKPIWAYARSPYIDKLKVKAFSMVIAKLKG